MIDDDEKTRKLMIRTLEKEGFGVAVAASGEEGIRLAQELLPICIILDVMMPSIDGWGVIQALKANPKTVDIPILMNTIVDDEKRAYKEGAVAYLSKPLRKHGLMSVLNKIVPLKSEVDILVIEDEEDMRSLLVRLLENQAWSVRQAENGAIALDQVVESMPDVILLDLIMPKMDGFEFISHLRKMPDGGQVPVVILSAKDLTPSEQVF